MGKTGVGSSWLTAVKRAFRSPTKENTATDNNSDTRSSTVPRHQHHPQQHEHNKKKERKGWLFRKPTNHEATHQGLTKNEANNNNNNNNVSEAEQRHAIAVAVATAKAAEAAVATAQAAMEVARLAAPPNSSYAKEHHAATVVQTAFRGYLARRALRALKGVVKLQALVRGHNARSQAKMTLRCMQALVRVQAQVLDQRVRRSNDSSSRKSTFSDTNSIWDSHHFQDASVRKSMSRNGSSIADEWDERTHTLEEVKALKRERNLSQAFSQQMWRNNRNKSFGNGEELVPREQPQWHDRWSKRSSTDQNNSFYKTVEIDNTSHYLPRHRHPPATPLPSRPITGPSQARSASPRYNRPQSPSLRSNYFYNGPLNGPLNGPFNGPIVPNYMAETESARARVRAQSAPRQRPATPERERGERMVAKKRLSYNNVGDHMRVEQQSNYSSCYSDSIGGEISPSSTTDLRKWLR